METLSMETLFQNPFFITALVFLMIWELCWKGVALWKAARNNERNWFIAILLLNTVGILPILYIQFFQKKR